MKKIEIADFVIRLLTLLAVVCGGLWAWYLYVESGATDWQNNITIKTEVLPYHDDLRLLVVHVQSKNPRPTKFELENSKHDSFELRVHTLPAGATVGKVFDEDEGDLLAHADLLKSAGGDYVFLPQAEMHDMRAIVVKANTWVSVIADMKIHTGTRNVHGQPDIDENSTSAVVYIPK
ncbi:hypothetical protein WL35_07935 [Burkholderia ubonensis]|uniref:hypothetical protein n=1 Tax=Burkholderia ubonensis TaxID=101571 RepID=UPI000752E286|nr:hypothetical protein [Burkholderia ubonensis]KWB49159.1 hypothetical protein WL35_07935 [Burkholderia ubonensis]